MITLQFVSSSGWSSKLIGWAGAGHLSHVDAVCPDGGLLGARSDKMGAAAPGVQVRPQGYYRFSRRVLMQIPATQEQESRFWIFLNHQLAKPYDRMAILAFVFNRDWRETDSWICSELQAAALEAAGIVPRLYLDANKISPVALALAVSAIPGTTWTEKK